MKTILFLFLSLALFSASAQTWTEKQIDKANTAENIDYLTLSEKTTIMYINLARLFPKDFVKYELENYFGPYRFANYYLGSEYRESLIESLMTMEPVPALVFDQNLYESAKCFAIESGELGLISHERIKCEVNYHAECCSYGSYRGKDIAMGWLIDKDVESLGHRIACLSSALTKIGVGVAPHKGYDFCAVANFKQ